MILVLKQNNGEQWEDYHDWNEFIFQFKDKIELNNVIENYQKHLITLMLNEGVIIYYNQPFLDDQYNVTYLNFIQYEKPTKKNEKIYKRIIKTNSLVNYLEKHGYKPLDFRQIML